MQLSDFLYDLPERQIAFYPLQQRDASKLLVYKQGQIEHRQFTELPQQLPAGSLLVFNDTKVIPARLEMVTPRGQAIEIFLLEPAGGLAHADAMQQRGSSAWQAMVGGRRKWKSNEALLPARPSSRLELQITWADEASNQVHLQWQPDELTLAEVIDQLGEVPLPPYIKRETNAADRERYQTIWAKKQGAVAAPTASLHFTEQVLNQLEPQGIKRLFTTLHVGAATFQPIKASDVRQHTMHAEKMEISLEFLKQLQAHQGPVIAVGTTALRVLETVYWLGCKLAVMPVPLQQLSLLQEEPYMLPALPRQQALQRLIDAFEKEGIDILFSATQLYIRPGYEMRIARGIVTNFHQPGSSLIVLISALVGPAWREIYQQALDNNYRFLSYGDSSLLLPSHPLNA